MKKIFTIPILLLVSIVLPIAANGFYDIQYAHPNYTAISYLSSYGRLNGFTDGSFRPNEEITRASFVAMLVASLNLYADESEYEKCYSDIKNKWYENEVCYAKEHDWLDDLDIAGKRFKPTQKISAGEALSITAKAFDTYRGNLSTICTGSLRRGEAAQMIYEAMMNTHYSISYPSSYNNQYYYYSGTTNVNVPDGYLGPYDASSNYYLPPSYYSAPPNYYTPPSYYYTPPSYTPPGYVPPGYAAASYSSSGAQSQTQTASAFVSGKAAACADAGIANMPAQTPQAYSINYCALSTIGEPVNQALLGQAYLPLVWGEPYDFTVPDSLWAMALAYTADMFGINPNYLMGLVIKESHANCSHWGGCFQLTGGFPEVRNRYPLYIDGDDDEQAMINAFGSASVVASLYIRFGEAMWARDYQWNAFYGAAADSEARAKIVSRGYNRGLWDQGVRNILNTDRNTCMAAPDLFACFPSNSSDATNAVALDHAQAVLRYCNSLMQSANFYDARLNWGDIQRFISQVPQATFSAAAGVDWAAVTARATKAFTCLQDNTNTISYRYDFKTFLRSIKTLLPPVPEPAR